MIFFTTNASDSHGARVFIQQHFCYDETNEVIGLHELARELSVWRGANKAVAFPLQQDKSKPGLHMRFKMDGNGNQVRLLGYEVEAEEMAVLVKRCMRRRLIDITADLPNLEQVWG